MDKVDKAISRLREAALMSDRLYHQPLVICYSGGKDSEVLLYLAKAAKIRFEVQHSHTTADAPETVRHVRSVFHALECNGVKATIEYPYYKGQRVSMWSLIPQKRMPPTRLARYCCDVLKESGGKGRFISTGVRWAESTSRKAKRGKLEVVTRNISKKLILNNDNDEDRRLFESCKLKGKRVVNPIIDWTDTDIWDYIEAERLCLNPIYKCGFSRVGCVGCPMAGRKRVVEFARYPAYRQMYISAFDRMLKERTRAGLPNPNWSSGFDVYHWWMEDGVLPGQVDLLEEYNGK